MNTVVWLGIYWFISLIIVMGIRHYNQKKNLNPFDVRSKKEELKYFFLAIIFGPLLLPFVLVYFSYSYLHKWYYKDKVRPMPKKWRKIYTKDYIMVNEKFMPLCEYNKQFGKDVKLEEVYGKDYVNSLTPEDLSKMNTIMDNTLAIEENLPETEYKEASIKLANALINGSFNDFERILHNDVVLVLHKSKSFKGVKNTIAYWKDWLERLHNDKLSVKYEVKFCANSLRAVLSIKVKNYKEMYVMMRMVEGKITNMVFSGNPLQNPLVRYEDLDHLPYTTEYMKCHSKEKITPEANRMPCLCCGKPSEKLNWYKVEINKGTLGYIGQTSICPDCNKVVEYYPEILQRFNEPVESTYKKTPVENQQKDIKDLSLMGLRMFYNNTPLKGTKYTANLPEDITIKLEFSFGIDNPEYGPCSVKDIAENSNWLLFRELKSNYKGLYEEVKNCYIAALEDGIYEAANNLAILAYNYEQDIENGMRYFQKAIEGNSQYAMINYFTLLWSEEKYEDAILHLSNIKDYSEPSLRCMWNLAILYFYGSDYANNPLKKDTEACKYILKRIESFENNISLKEESSVIEKAKKLLMNIDAINTYSIKGEDFYEKRIESVIWTKDIKDKGEVFSSLTSLNMEEGWKLGLKLADNQTHRLGDESWFYCYDCLGHVEKELQKYINLAPTEMGAWEMYLLMSSSTVLPTFWHGGYIHRKFIFDISDLEHIDALHGKDLSVLMNDGQLLPKVSIEKDMSNLESENFFSTSEEKYIANVYCCYWNEWKGLVREHIRMEISSNKIVSYKNVGEYIFYKYDCGIRF